MTSKKPDPMTNLLLNLPLGNPNIPLPRNLPFLHRNPPFFLIINRNKHLLDTDQVTG